MITKRKKPSTSARRPEVKKQNHGETLARIYQWLIHDWFNTELSQPDRLYLSSIVRELQKGRDPRSKLGISAKRGAPPHKAEFHWFIAAHYWQLSKNVKMAKVARSMVSETWGLSDGQVRKIASQYKSLFRSKLTAGSDRAIYHACSLAPYFRKLSAK